jgi:hypothetical protein
MITLSDYFGPWIGHVDATDGRVENAEMLLSEVNLLLMEAEDAGLVIPLNPRTGTLVSGSEYGGFRPQDCPEGAPSSSHKEGKGVDIYDPRGMLDAWITDKILKLHDLYREAPSCTSTWCHLTIRAPSSGNRSFYP